MTFSVIIPVYNILDSGNSIYFKKLLFSISENFYNAEIKKSCLEIIIINDFPEQNIFEYVKVISQGYHINDKIKIINNVVNKGQAYSRNRGAEIAEGEYLHFIDQDDFISPDFYENIFSCKKNSDIYIVNPFLFVTSNKSIVKLYKKHVLLLYENALYISDLKFFCLFNIAISPGQYLISKNIFDKVEGYTNLLNKGSDDWGIFVKLILFNKKITIHFISNSIFYYRLHSSQGMKYLNIRASVKEQVERIMSNADVDSLYMRVLMKVKTSSLFKNLIKLLYMLFYNRTNIKQ